MSFWNGTIPEDGGVDSYLFVAQKDALRRYARAGAAQQQFSQPGGANNDYSAIATDESYGYYFNQTTNTLYRRHKIWEKLQPNAQQESLGSMPNGAFVVDIGVDATQVYLLSLSGQVHTIPKTGGPVVATTLGTAVGAAAKAILVTDTAVYVTHWTASRDGEVVAVKKDGTSKVLANDLAEPNEMFVDVDGVKKTIYWTNKSDGTIRRLLLE
jgi:hypothetical protein